MKNKIIYKYIGKVLIGFSLLQLIPLFVSLFFKESILPFLIPLMISIIVGILLNSIKSESKRIYSKDVINSVYLTKLQREPKKKRRVSRISPFRSRRVSEPILSMEDFERRFQFNNLVRAYNHLLVTKKSTSSSDEKDNSKLILPMIKEIKIKKHGMNDTVTENEIKYNESENDTDNKIKNFNNSISDNIDTYNSKKESKDKSVKSKLNKSDATLTQSQNLNKSTSKSKLSLNYDKERKRLLLRNLSNDSLFAQYKVRYLIALKDYQDKTKLAKQNYQNELEKIRNEILPKSKNEEFFKAYEFDFNSNKMQLKLKNQFNLKCLSLKLFDSKKK